MAEQVMAIDRSRHPESGVMKELDYQRVPISHRRKDLIMSFESVSRFDPHRAIQPEGKTEFREIDGAFNRKVQHA